jgi:hypothetical protein
VKLIRITAPFASSTSLPQSSQTSLVTRATVFLPLKGIDCDEPSGKDPESSGRSGLLNSPGTEQAQHGLFLLVET